MSLKSWDVSGTLRMQDWWTAKAANLLVVLYSATLITALHFSRVLLLLVPAVVAIVGIGGFGHVTNDLCDIQVDTAAGKHNALASLTFWKRISLVAVLLALALLPWRILPWDKLSVAFLAAEFSILIAYAIPPVRLKERAAWAILADAVYAYTFPALLAAHTFFLAAGRRTGLAYVLSLFVWQMALGVRHFLNHLALDRSNDIRAGVSTVATIKGSRYIHLLIRKIILPIELLGFLGFLVTMNQYAHFVLLVVTAIFLVISSFHIILAMGRRYPFLTYRFSKTQLDWFYQAILPLILLCYLVALDLRFFVLLVAHLLLFVLAERSFKYRIPQSLRSAPAIAPNGRAAPSELGGAVRSDVSSANLKARAGKSHVSVAVVNINKDKYTETFVKGLVSRLKYNVLYLYGGELPRLDNDDREFLSSWPSIRAAAAFLETTLRLPRYAFLMSSIRSYLQAKSIRVVLAEFGPVGNQMLPITRDLGIPLVVYFHGYDVFDRTALNQYSALYLELFDGAARILGVSETMLDRLEELGAPREKLFHLPAFVNLEMFPYSDHSTMRARFLSVGRFAETKSPHLTLLAFHQVLKAVPEATLTMVGKGGGGELFEACVILTRALGIEDRVEFTGVLTHSEVAQQMRRARVFVQHSLTPPESGDMEGKPVAIMESMANGLPVVATRHSGISELIEDEVTGLLVPEYDIEAMAAAMIRLAQDDALVHRIGVQASCFIHNHPLISRHVDIMENLLDEAIAQGGG
jgi:colanic acid/amylovoran biosynthesis glycosyltransferase